MRALPLAVLALVLCGCGAAAEAPAPGGGERLAGHGVEIVVPEGWHGDVTKLGPHHAATLRVATFPLAAEPEIGHDAQTTMGADDLLIALADYGVVPARGEAVPEGLPIRVEEHHVGNFEGFRAPVATTSVVVAGTTLQVWVVAAAAPTAAQLERANSVLSTLRVERARWRDHVDEQRGLAVRIPPGWAVADETLTPNLREPVEVLSVGTGPIRPGGDRCAHVPEQALEALRPTDALVTVVEFADARGLPPRPGDLLAADGWEPESRDCLGEPHRLDYRLIPFSDAGRDFYLYVAFGEHVTAERRREAAALLSSLRFDRAADVSFIDDDVGVSGRHPRGWHRIRSLTGFVEPREVLALATYPLRTGAEAGECAPDTAREDMPEGGAFLWLLEYRAALPPERFPDRPTPFRIPRERLAGDLSCFPGPGWSTTFGDAGRKFQLLVAFGGRPSDARVAEVEAILDALEFEHLPAPPPDPYAGWAWISTEPGDSLRTPPGWASASGTRARPAGPYGPPLFFTANRKLRGLPAEDRPAGRDLPGPLPESTLANWFPADGVLVWVLEESGRATLAQEFVPIDRDWPEPEDFEPVEIFTKPAPQLRWLLAAGTFRRHRFSVWIAAGPKAAEEDVELALKSASSLAVSGCDRSADDPCVETR